MIRVVLAAGFLAASAPGFAQAVDPAVKDWRKCAFDKGVILMRSGEPAETIAKVALYECRSERQLVRDLLGRTHPPRVVDVAMEQAESEIKDLMISAIVQARAK
jgi:hypothetical protein